MAKRLLHLDIETAPHKSYTWGLFDQNVSLDQIMEPGFTLCWAAKWEGDKRVLSAWHTDRHFLTGIHALLEEAEIVVTYNGNRFDLPTLNKEFVLAGLSPPAPYRSVDLYQTVKRRFRFASNKLDFVAQALGLGCKVKHKGFLLWKECMDGDPVAKATMLRYNKGDVTLLEKVHDHLLPWIPNYPRTSELDGCSSCGSTQLQKRGFHYTQVGKYQRYQCTHCGSWHRDGVNLLVPTKGRKRNIT